MNDAHQRTGTIEVDDKKRATVTTNANRTEFVGDTICGREPQ